MDRYEKALREELAGYERRGLHAKATGVRDELRRIGAKVEAPEGFTVEKRPAPKSRTRKGK